MSRNYDDVTAPLASESGLFHKYGKRMECGNVALHDLKMCDLMATTT